MAGNQVTLTFAGDSSQLEKAFGNVGQAAKGMETDVATAGKSFDSVGEGFDRAEQRAMGFRDTITGVQDSVKGFGSILKGDFSGEALLTAGMGVGDLASGFSNLLVPSLKSAWKWLGTTKVAMLAQAAGAKIATAAQWLWNAAMSANPVGLIIIGIAALIAIIVLLVKNWDTVREVAGKAWDWIKDKAVAFWEWLKGLPAMIGNVFSSVADFISRPFKAAFNFISDAWNNTIGKLSWTVPSWVPFIGGNTISVPQLPKFHTGTAAVSGAFGGEMLAVLRAGEEVRTPGQSGNTVIEFRSSGRRTDDLLLQMIASALKGQGLQVVTR